LFRSTPGSAFEKHVLEEVRYAVESLRLMPRADTSEHTK
jgi:hypothetical protein